MPLASAGVSSDGTGRSIDALIESLGPNISLSWKDWKDATDLGRLSRRPKTLRDLDDALAAYHEKDGIGRTLQDVAEKFDAWVDSGDATVIQRGPWALLELQSQIASAVSAKVQSGKMTGDPALDNLVNLAKDSLSQLMKDKGGRPRRLVPRSEYQQGLQNSVEKAMDEYDRLSQANAISGGEMADKASESLKGMFSDFSGVRPAEESVGSKTALDSFCKTAGDIISAVGAPVEVVAAIGSAAMNLIDKSKIASNRKAFSRQFGLGPSEAIAALEKMIEREQALKTVEVGVAAAKCVATFAGTPAAAAALGAIAEVVMNHYVHTVEMEEIEAGQKQLAEGKFDVGLFEKCPLLGCYFLNMADTSLLLDWTKDDIYSSKYMDVIEQMRKDAGPALDKSAEYIRSANFVLSGTEGFKGLQLRTNFSNNRIEFILKNLEPKTIATVLATKLNQVASHDSSKIKKNKKRLKKNLRHMRSEQEGGGMNEFPGMDDEDAGMGGTDGSGVREDTGRAGREGLIDSRAPKSDDFLKDR